MVRPLIPVLVLLSAVVACSLDGPDFQGKSCTTSADCPALYSCVLDGSGAQVCNLGVYNGQVGVDGGIDYCSGAQAVLNANCTLGCHGPSTAGSGQDSFRLDYYEPAAGVAAVGAYAKRDRIQTRINDANSPMPPAPAQLSAGDKALLNSWVAGGAPFCFAGAGP